MATYKVPQDVEADDKLLGPFSFRQFVYLMIVFGLLMLAFALFQIFPLLAVIPVPFILFFAVLALPLKKDQPMETYLAALVSFYTKPNKRIWVPGQSESTIMITAPKQVEAPRARNLSGSEASHRLSFLAEIVDSEGHAIKDAGTIMKDDFYAEAYNTTDMFERGNSSYANTTTSMYEDDTDRRNEVIEQMRSAIESSEFSDSGALQMGNRQILNPSDTFGTISDSVLQATSELGDTGGTVPVFSPVPEPTPAITPSENIQAEADRIRAENESETYISLH